MWQLTALQCSTFKIIHGQFLNLKFRLPLMMKHYMSYSLTVIILLINNFLNKMLLFSFISHNVLLTTGSSFGVWPSIYCIYSCAFNVWLQAFLLGIEFYLFVSHGGMKRQRSAFRNLHVDPLSLHTSMRNKQVEFNPYIYTLTTLSKLYRFWLRNIRFLIQNTWSLFYGRHYSSLHRLMSLHRKLNVKIFLMLIVAENTGSVNIWKQNSN